MCQVLMYHSYEVITTPTDVIMVMEYAGEELFNYIVQKGKHGVSIYLVDIVPRSLIPLGGRMCLPRRFASIMY